MKKRIDFMEEKEIRESDRIGEKLNQEFKLPEAVEKAKEDAFAQIREKAAKQSVSRTEKTETEKIVVKQPVKPKNAGKNSAGKNSYGKNSVRKRRTGLVYKTVAGMAAAAAVFSGVCIANPAFAANIPLVGSVFKRIGNSLGFAGDYEKYATTLTEKEPEDGSVQVDYDEQEETGDTEKEEKEPSEEGGDTLYSKTVNGVTVSLDQVYCNDAALYLSLLVKSEKPLPETEVSQDGMPWVGIWDSEMKLSFNPGFPSAGLGALDGKMLDEYTYAGVLRLEMRELKYNYEGYERFSEAKQDWLKEKGYDYETIDWQRSDEIAKELGLESFADESFKAVGLDAGEYAPELEVPDNFTVDLDIRKISGLLPEDKRTVPEMPEEFRKEYEEGMAANGLDEADYENFTEEEKKIEHELSQKMWNKYTEKYPETQNYPNSYEQWILDGPWKFRIPVEVNLSENETKEINLLDENGYGITAVHKTPFEFTMDLYDPEMKYVAVMLDADGDLMDNGNVGGSMDTLAIRDRDVSTVYVYLCDYYEYMDELKGYYWSPDYETKKAEKSFKELLDERAVLKTEVVFP